MRHLPRTPLGPTGGKGSLDGIGLDIESEDSHGALPVLKSIRILSGFEFRVASPPVFIGVTHRILMLPFDLLSRRSERRGADVIVQRVKGLRLTMFAHPGLEPSQIVKVLCVCFMHIGRIRSKFNGSAVFWTRAFPLTLKLANRHAI